MRMSLRTGRAALALLILALAAGAYPEAKKLATLDEVAAAGLANSLDYAKARNAVAAAAAAVPALVKAKSSVLATTYSYDNPKTSSIAATLPILDQIGLSASVAQDLSSTLSASLNPLSHSDTRTQAQIAYQKALAAMDDKGRTAGSEAVKAALTWMSRSRQVATQEKLTALKEEAYMATKAANALDPTTTTLDDLVTALKDWSDARTALVKAQAADRSAETALYAALGSSKGEVEVETLDSGALTAALSSLEASLAGAASSGPAESYAAKAASLEVSSGRAKLASIWAFEPELAISAGIAMSRTMAVSPNASVKLSLSLDDLKGEAKAEARADLDIAVKTLALQKSTDSSGYDQALAAAQAAKLNGEGRKMARDQAAELAEVADFSYKSGSYSAIENETAALALAAAEDDYYQALADEYSAWLDLAAQAGR
jgi:outer membrane protein TolC